MQNQIPNGWQKVKLNEIANFNHNSIDKDFSYKEIEYIDISSVGTGKLLQTTKYKLSDAPGRAKRLISDGDTILSTVRPNRRSFLYINKPRLNLVVSTGFAVLSPKKETDSYFLYCLVTQKSFTTFLSNNTQGSAYPAISTNFIENAEVKIPSYEVQKRIGQTLYILDEKMRVNNKIAKTLEDMAQTIFKEWFVKFRFPGWEKAEFIDSKLGKIPKNWKLINLEKILKLKHGFAFKGSQFINKKTANVVVRMGNFQENGGLQFSDNTLYLENIEKYNKYLLNPGDLVMILSDITREGRLIGKVGIIPNDRKNYLLNQRVAKIETDSKYFLFLLNFFNSKEFHQHCLSRADSATVLNLKNEHINNYKIALPDGKIIVKFNEISKPIITKLEAIKYENQKLAALRDLLLPKLMKGEIRIQ